MLQLLCHVSIYLDFEHLYCFQLYLLWFCNPFPMAHYRELEGFWKTSAQVSLAAEGLLQFNGQA